MVKVSIIMPCFNCGKYLDDAFKSVLAQTFDDWELIFINDGSTDDSLKIAQGYASLDARIKILDQENTGVIAARNNGIAMARGEYIFPLDGDDKIAPNCLERLYEIMESHKSQKFAIAAPKFHHFGYETFSYYIMPRPTRFNIYSRKYWNVISSMFRKSDFDAVGGFDPVFKLGTEDSDFWLTFIDRGGKIYLSEDILFFYRNYAKKSASNRNFFATDVYGRQIQKLLNKKHPRMRIAMFMHKLGKMFFETNVARETVNVTRIFRIPIRTKYRGKL